MSFSRSRKSKTFLVCNVIYVGFAITFVVLCLLRLWTVGNQEKPFVFRSSLESPVVKILPSAPSSEIRNSHCSYFNCFNVYKCDYAQRKLKIYIYPNYNYEDHNGIPISVSMSRQFKEILQSIYRSKYYVSDPREACIFVPSIDLLNQNNLRLKEISQVLASLPYWHDGINHLLFNMLPGSAPGYNPVLEVDSHKAMIAGGGFSTWTYRKTHDVSLPVYSLIEKPFDLDVCERRSRPHFLTSSQVNIHTEYRQKLQNLAEEHPELLVLNGCPKDNTIHNNATFRCRSNKMHSYPEILQDSTFCLVLRGARLGQAALSEVLQAGCIPVVIGDGYVMPFAEVIDWKRASIAILEENLGSELLQILKFISEERISEMRHQVCFLWQKYFSSMEKITNTVLEILNSRIFPHAALTYEDWNDPPSKGGFSVPLLLPTKVSKRKGFTAVILTHDRIDSLFQVITNVAQAPSLAKILVVWNNQVKLPPAASIWPKISQPLKVIQTRENKLSNRFYPYDEIQTEAVLAIDDDIVMLTTDELEFGYKVWCEFPDRIVGFPSRVHVFDNATKKWRYKSEWTNEISMILTGAAFYHKHYNYLYTNSMPGDVKQWVDDHRNCEDIAMNFLVANATGKGPVKVTSRKKFKCPECAEAEMLPADVVHMAQRSECINRFAENYGRMTLKTVEFRADPVLYKDNFPEKLKRFNGVGSL